MHLLKEKAIRKIPLLISLDFQRTFHLLKEFRVVKDPASIFKGVKDSGSWPNNIIAKENKRKMHFNFFQRDLPRSIEWTLSRMIYQFSIFLTNIQICRSGCSLCSHFLEFLGLICGRNKIFLFFSQNSTSLHHNLKFTKYVHIKSLVFNLILVFGLNLTT